MTRRLVISATAVLLLAPRLHAQHAGMDHSAHRSGASMDAPTHAGQAAYATIVEIVRMLEADSATDWKRVNLEALRRHLVDMDEVVMRASIENTEIPGGVRVDFSGTGRTLGAIQRMATAHGEAIDGTADLSVRVEQLANGVRWYVTSRSDAQVARIRGLGGIGLLTVSDHHAPHHLAIARGDGMEAHNHAR